MKRKLTLCALLLCALFLSGCTVEADRIYTVCKNDGENVYCYKEDGSFYYYSNGILVPTSGVGLQAYPALHVTPCSGEFSFTYVLPGLYSGTLASVNHYVYKLQQESSSELIIQYQDWNNIDFIVKTDNVSTRIIYNIKGDVRIYAVDNSDNPIEPLYINVK